MFKKNTLKRYILLHLVLPLIFCIGFLVFYNFNSIHLYNNEIAESAIAMQELYAQNLENELVKADNFMASIVVNNDNYSLLLHSLTELQTHLALVNIKDICKSQLSRSETFTGYLVYSANNHSYREAYKDDVTYLQKEKIMNYITEKTEGRRNYAGLKWFYVAIGQDNYLMRIFGNNGVYIIGLINFDDIAMPENNRFINNLDVVFRTTEGKVITNQKFTEDNNISFLQHKDKYSVTGKQGKFLITGNKIESTDVEMYYIKRNPGFLGRLQTIQILLFIISLLSILAIPNHMYQIQRSINRPIQGLIQKMEKIKEGDLEVTAPQKYRLEELREINDTFDQMVASIKSLKIENYEQALEKQNAQLQYLQLQLKPHFYLNGLKSLFGMAENQKYSEIQDMILILSEHLRYNLKDTMQVTLKEELEYTMNYIKMQKVGIEVSSFCRLEVEEHLLKQHVPPLLIQTFVENSFKYGTVSDRELEIRIHIKSMMAGSAEYLNLIVCDNGQGYPQDLLLMLNNDMEDEYFKEHIGIKNVIRRLQIMYQGRVEYAFTNQEKGACSELFIPVSSSEQVGEES